MEKLTFNGVDIFNPIADKMDKIIDYFVMFYGEKYRARIEEKLKTNTTYIFMPKLAIHNWKSTYRNNMMDLIFEEEAFTLLQDILRDAGQLKETVPYEELVTTTFAKEAAKTE